jgi:hypothetical protein
MGWLYNLLSTKEGWLYLAVVIDLFLRAIIGWSISTHLKKDMVCEALTMVLFKRKFPKEVEEKLKGLKIYFKFMSLVWALKPYSRTGFAFRSPYLFSRRSAPFN